MIGAKCIATGQSCVPARIHGRFAATVLLASAMLWLSGCARDTIEHTYGRRRGATGGPSVNGTGVLSQMFKQAGHRVYTRSVLSPRIESYDTIVWAPNDFGLPSDESQAFLEDWLSNAPGRTLIYIGRDYDAETAYWEAVLPTAPPGQMAEVTRRLAQARARHAEQRLAIPVDDECRWFAVKRDGQRRQIGRHGDSTDTLHGTWCENDSIDVAKADIQIEARLVRPKDPPTGTFGGEYRSQDQLTAGQDVLVRRVTNGDWPTSQILVVTNGSFLLNLPLVEKEHRKLAAKLVGQCRPRGKTAFLESGPGGVFVFGTDPNSKHPTGLEAFTEWPIGVILMHFVALGLIFLLSRVAIFGRPLELDREAISDFGRHVTSLGESLAKTQDERYARRQLAEYHESAKHESKEA